MDERETKQEELVVVYRVERRAEKRGDLSFQEIIRLARKRGTKGKELWEGPYGGRQRRRS